MLVHVDLNARLAAVEVLKRLGAVLEREIKTRRSQLTDSSLASTVAEPDEWHLTAIAFGSPLL